MESREQGLEPGIDPKTPEVPKSQEELDREVLEEAGLLESVDKVFDPTSFQGALDSPDPATVEAARKELSDHANRLAYATGLARDVASLLISTREHDVSRQGVKDPGFDEFLKMYDGFRQEIDNRKKLERQNKKAELNAQEIAREAGLAEARAQIERSEGRGHRTEVLENAKIIREKRQESSGR